MIKIDIDSCIFVDGDARCEGDFKIRGDYNNVAIEIYTILKSFEEQCPEEYIAALERVINDKMEVEE